MTAIATHEQYTTEKAICDKANTYWKAHATFSRGGCSSMSKELSAHPDYAACDNDMRGRIEQYELSRDKPEAFTAYVASEGGFATVWTGLIIGHQVRVSATKRRGWQSGKVYRYTFKTIWGDTYAGYGQPGCCINLKRCR